MFISAPFDLIRNGYGSSSKVQYGNQPPLGILYLVGELRRHGHECQLIDAATFSLSHEEIERRTREFGAQVIGISTMTPSAPGAYELAEFLKARTGLPIMMGGVHCTSFKEQVLEECPAVDLVCVGEGEMTIAEMVEVVDGKRDPAAVLGICYRNAEGKPVRTEGRPLVMDLDTLAFPARDLLDHTAYRPLPLSFRKLPMTSMVTSRGCPYGHCTFCFEAGNNAFKFRRHSPEYVIREIEETIVPHGIKEVLFWDDIFLIKKTWVSEFCEQVERFNLSWSCYAWPKMVNREMLFQAKKAGCWAIFYGFESGDQKLLDVINKKMTLDHSRQAARWTHDAGMATRASFMLALPGENPQLAKKTVDFAVELDVTMAQFLPTFPEPGTELYNLALKEGQIVKDYKGRMAAAYVPNDYAGPEEVEKMVRYAYRRFYLRPRFIWNHLKRIRSLDDIRYYFHGFQFVMGLMFKRSDAAPAGSEMGGTAPLGNAAEFTER